MPQGNAVAARPAGAAGAAPAEEAGTSSWVWKILPAIGMYMLMQLLTKQFAPATTPAQATVNTADGKTVTVPAPAADIPPYLLRPKQLDDGAVYNPIPQKIAPIWPEDSNIDIVVTLSPSFALTPIKDTPEEYVVLKEKNFRIGNFKDKRAIDTTINVPPSVQNNGTLWGHVYIGLTGASLDPTDASFDPASAYHFVHPLTQYIAKKKVFKTRSLLAGKNETQDEEDAKLMEEIRTTGPIVGSYYHPNTSLSFIPNTGVMVYPTTHPAVRQFLHLEPTGARDGSGQNSWYYPILFVNTFWQLKSHMTLLNETVKTLPLHIDLDNLANWKFTTMASIELSSRETARNAAYGQQLPGGGDGSEIEMVKEILLDTNPILLAITVVVSILHIILETLAFGSDIAHYRKKKDNVGISVRSILANVFMQTVIFLYLIDQSANTSWMILGSQGVGIIIEFWKITTIVNVRIRPAPPGSLFPYRITFEDKHKLSDTEEKTKEYDEIAFKYMYIAGVPLLLAYAAYSLVYDTHKSWYSYLLATLVGSVYAYGFLMMVPSLYINYRLKSVAHMPGKAMVYKFLNTFIDDLFAFTIKMPFLHRLSTFRDDIIFFIYIYQRWAYKVDYTRVNEFGQGGEEDEKVGDEVEGEKKAEGASLPPAVAPAVTGAEEKTAKASGVEVGKAKRRRG
ncbi:cleft lip and palate transmembrane 1 [Coniochaeta sp. 2T2.1]|nr:cleft lip and palate transmembrane 1 [Coniochaeta sp. 2T2.1]